MFGYFWATSLFAGLLIIFRVDGFQHECQADSQPWDTELLGIIVICHKRTRLLRDTIQSLLSVRGVRLSQIVAIQDGSDGLVKAIIRDEFGVALLQNVNNYEDDFHGKPRDLGSMRIARHYKFALDQGFKHFGLARGLIIVEDDMLFSPDFLEYFLYACPLLELDSSLWTASAWNDNGFQGFVHDRHALLRTDHFPGLGWVMLRKLWENEFREKWPEEHWDWFLRDPVAVGSRDSLYPSVSRVFHTGTSGTYMNEKLHEQYYQHILHNKDDGFRWSPQDFSDMVETRYEGRIVRDLLYRCKHVQNGRQLSVNFNIDLKFFLRGSCFVVWHRSNPDPRFAVKFRPLAKRFGLWHQIRRGARLGVHWTFYPPLGVDILFVNLFNPSRKRKAWPRRKKTCVGGRLSFTNEVGMVAPPGHSGIS